MEGSSGVAAGAQRGSELQGNAAVTTTRSNGVVATSTAADKQGRLAVAGMTRKRGAMNGAGASRSQNGVQVQFSSPATSLQPQMMPLHRLVNACHHLLKPSMVPPTDDTMSIISCLMDKIGILEVDMMDEIRFFKANSNLAGPQNPPVITWKRLYKNADNNFMVSVLYLPRGAAMPFHDHPAGMTGITKLLVGSAHVEACNWVQPCVSAAGPGPEGSAAAMLAEKVREDDLTGRVDRPWVVSGDVARFVNGWDGTCVFLWVCMRLISAPDVEHPRSFFYRHSPYTFDLNVAADEVTEERKSKLVWLQKVDYPQDVVKLISLPYKGPQIY